MTAREQNPARQLKDLTECSICTNVFTDPRMLPCIHTFCFQCLKRTGESTNKKRGDKMPCPLCRKEFIIPVEGIAGLQKNFFMENLIQMTTNLEQSNTITPCDICKIGKTTDATNIPEATMQCIDCQHKYCDDCSKQHLMQQLNKTHQIVIIGGKTNEGTGPTFQAKHCTKHTQKPLDYYCGNCEKIVCVSCFVESHKLHDCIDVATVDKEFRYKMEVNAWKMSSFNDEMLALRMNVEQRKANFLKDISEKEDAIRKRSRPMELNDTIDQHIKAVLEALHVAKQSSLKELEVTIEEIDRCCTILTSFGAYCTQLSSKGSASDICSCIDEVMRRADELEKDHEKFAGRSHQSIEVSFKPTDLQALIWMSNNNIVGRIQNETETTTQFENYAVVGLYYGKSITKDVVQINLRLPNKVPILKRIPTTMEGDAATAVYCNTMYVTGIGDNCDEIWKYNLASGWMKCASLFQGRRNHSAAFIGEVLYICGGYVYSERRALDSVEAYNAVTNKCTRVGKLVHCVQSSGNCVPLKTSLYIFGGGDKYYNALTHVQVYDTKLNTCSLLSKPIPRPQGFMRAALWDTFTILVGCDTCFIFNLKTETWQERQRFKTDVYYFGLVLENDRLFVIGGGNSEKDKYGQHKWKFRDEVRYVPFQNILENKQTAWKIHAKLPAPSLVHSYAKLRFPVTHQITNTDFY